MIDTDRIAQFCQEYEHGEGPEDIPFDIEGVIADPRFMNIVSAFSQAAVQDTPKIEPAEEYHGALVVAGLVQGMWIGYRYAKEVDQ